MPNRILRDFRDSPTISGLSDFEERVFIRMILTADDFGRGLASNLHATCFPVADIPRAKCSQAVANLAKAGIVQLYQDHSGRELFWIVKFNNTPRAKHSRFPSYDECKQLACNMQTTCSQDACNMQTECTPKLKLKPGTETKTETVLLRYRKSGKGFAYSSDFEAAWQAWPSVRKGEKGAAFKRWEQCRDRPPLESILASIEAHKAYCQKWIDGFVPEMVNWISGRGFDTDPTPQAEPKRFDANGMELF